MRQKFETQKKSWMSRYIKRQSSVTSKKSSIRFFRENWLPICQEIRIQGYILTEDALLALTRVRNDLDFAYSTIYQKHLILLTMIYYRSRWKISELNVIVLICLWVILTKKLKFHKAPLSILPSLIFTPMAYFLFLVEGISHDSQYTPAPGSGESTYLLSINVSVEFV